MLINAITINKNINGTIKFIVSFGRMDHHQVVSTQIKYIIIELHN
jgi:hypothetical protein